MFNLHFYAKLKKSACYAKHSKYASFLTKINISFCEKNEKKFLLDARLTLMGKCRKLNKYEQEPNQ